MILALGKPNSFISNEIKTKFPIQESNKIFETPLQAEEAPKLETKKFYIRFQQYRIILKLLQLEYLQEAQMH